MANTETLRGVDSLLEQLTLEEKVSLLAGQGRCRTTGVARLGIPPLDNQGCLLPCGTAMGATFDVKLMGKVGQLLAGEALCRHISIILAPVVCIQRSPLLGRGFEAFGEDPVLSGLMGAAYTAGIQSRGVASCIKHFAAHDQSWSSTEDNAVMSERTLREMHTLPFQLVMKESKPWAVMTSYNKINGVHASEDPKLLREILRQDWGYDGLVLSDWWGTYSTTESINATMDLEMPGPTLWRGGLLVNAVGSRKVTTARINESARRVLEIVQKVQPAISKAKYDVRGNDTEENRRLIRKVAAESIVLLKNDNKSLPLKPDAKTIYGLIGDHFTNAAFAGGGSSEVDPYYVVQPLDAFVEDVGKENITFETGCYSHSWTPLLWDELYNEAAGEPGLHIEFFQDDPEVNPDAAVIHTEKTRKSFMIFADCLPQPFPDDYFVKVRTKFTSAKTARYRFGLSAAGKAKLVLDGKTIIDQWTDHPEKKKTDITPGFNNFTMERFAEFDVQAGQPLNFEIYLTNKNLGTPTGIAPAAGARLGGCEIIDEDKTIAAAVELASRVDVAILMTGLSSDYELENSDRSSLSLPGRVDELIERVLNANPNTIIITQSGMPILMPWAAKARTLAHAWLGGQEAGHGMLDFLFGRINPSARMPLTFPKRLEDNPAFLTFGKADRDLLYGEGVFVGHRYYEYAKLEPEFYFGHGLSYTEFSYSNLAVPAEFVASADHKMQVTVDVKNTGSLGGAEVVQLYVVDPESTFQRPRKELKAFQKVWLEPGQVETVKLSLDKYALSYWSQEHDQWIAENGEFVVIVSRSANPKDELLKASFRLPKTFFWSGL
ncbi:hypothetical protein CkaCkLH20_09910 [Colletotrichum karsti]|uniref:beta-glucosidase n=1 Tax=Colletotrichum karsti TaxID=1095194 RepID=A0A9P6LH02_9PEZI|nr:uncharacterized protein CkaCkLH20_09910 [Colletotrichum karsti]KAF9872731.1 hypothetical protein CkaCkLH20_09910 [Colletotrichum karsti]